MLPSLPGMALCIARALNLPPIHASPIFTWKLTVTVALSPRSSPIQSPAYAMVGRVGRLPVVGGPRRVVLVNGFFNRIEALGLLGIDWSTVPDDVDEYPYHHEKKDGKNDGSKDGERIDDASPVFRSLH